MLGYRAGWLWETSHKPAEEGCGATDPYRPTTIYTLGGFNMKRMKLLAWLLVMLVILLSDLAFWPDSSLAIQDCALTCTGFGTGGLPCIADSECYCYPPGTVVICRQCQACA